MDMCLKKQKILYGCAVSADIYIMEKKRRNRVRHAAIPEHTLKERQPIIKKSRNQSEAFYSEQGNI